MTRNSVAVAVLLALSCFLAACRDRGAPAGSPRSGPAASATPPPAAAPPSADPNDPAEAGIDDLPRLARYVFRTMQRHDAACPLENRYRDSLHFAFEIEVARGRMTRVGLAEVAFEGASGRRSLPKAVWPREVSAYVACLEPVLKATPMSPAPADGAYQPFYSIPGRPDGIAAP